MSKGAGTLLTGLLAFAGGVVTGLLLTPRSGKENRQWIHDHSEGAKNWIEDKSHKIIEDGERKLEKVSNSIKKGVKDNLPDLYEATESLQFGDEELKENE